MEKVINFKVDWLAFTYKCPLDLNGCSVWDNFLDEFPEFAAIIDQMSDRKKGMLGYTQVLHYNDDFMILYHPDCQEMGVHVSFPSHGLYQICRLFDLYGDYDDFDLLQVKDFLTLLRSRSCRVTRMDFAYDDFNKTFYPRDFLNWWTSGQISTHSLHMEFIHGKGDTFYMGRRGSDRFLRIYDKDVESGHQVPAIRYEFEMKGRFLNFLIDKIIEGVSFSIADLMDSMFTIKESYDFADTSTATNSRKDRASVLPEWERFLATIRESLLTRKVEIKLDPVKREISFSKRYRWLQRQCLPSVYMVLMCYGEERMLDLIRANSSRLSEYDLNMLKKYKSEMPEWNEYINQVEISA